MQILYAFAVIATLIFAVYLYWRVFLQPHLQIPIRSFAVHDLVERPSLTSASDITVNQFLGFIEEAKAAGLRFVGLDDFLSSTDHRDILLTFDDGLESIYKYAFPILMKNRIPAIVFMLDAYEGKPTSWDYRSSARVHLSAPQIEEMSASGLVTFGNHSATHPDLTRVSRDRLTSEVQTSTDKHRTAFSYPFDRFNEDVISAVKHAGYMSGFCLLSGRPSLWRDDFARPRFPLNRFDNRFTFRIKLRGGKLMWLEVVKSRIIGKFAPFTYDWQGRP